MSQLINIKDTLTNTRNLTVEMDKIKISNSRWLEIDGTKCEISSSAWADLMKLCGMTNKVVHNLNYTIHEKAGFSVMKEVMKHLSTKKGQKVTLVVDTATKVIARICLEGEVMGSNSAIAPAAIQELIEYAVEKNNKVSLVDTQVLDGGTKIAFNLRWDVKIPLSMKGEDIAYGKQITWDMLGPTIVGDFIERQVCTNGMRGIVPGNFNFLDSTSNLDEWYDSLYKSIVNPNQEIIKHYENKVFNAQQTQLSVYEYNQIKAKLVTTWFKDLEKVMRHLGNEQWKYEYTKFGIELDKLNAGQLQNCPTPVNAWDAINALTDLSSHTYNSPVTPRERNDAQGLAGKLLNKVWDSTNWMFGLPSFRTRKANTNIISSDFEDDYGSDIDGSEEE